MINITAVGRRIAEVRAEAGYSQTAFSEESGFSISSVKNYERGARAPSPEFLAYTCITLGVSADWLLFGRDAPSNAEPYQPRVPHEPL